MWFKGVNGKVTPFAGGVALSEKGRRNPDERPIRLADRLGAEILATKLPAERKATGLYLTPVEVADFMAARIDAATGFLRILDPAAGSGTLICGVVERLASAGNGFQAAELIAYETDPGLQGALAAVLDYLTLWAARRGIILRTRLERRDFILAHGPLLKTTRHLFHADERGLFDLVVANPPYFKIPKSDPRAQVATSVVHGQPNIYALFMAAGAAVLRDGGTFLFIVPRSFASGPYFRLFRERFFASVRPTSVHVFGSRREAFSRDEVLQENIILQGVRENDWQAHGSRFTLDLSSSFGLADLHTPAHRSIPLAEAIRATRNGAVLRLPTLKEQDGIVAAVDSWTGSLHQYGMNISTGPVVAFRASELLEKSEGASRDCVPLIWMNHVHAMQVRFPNGIRKPQYIKRTDGENPLLLPNRNYVLLRRFSAKEERRRLVAAPWLKTHFRSSFVGIENHLNYIYRPGGELHEDEAYGLAAILNSRLLDAYFRVSSGNTQVSATELRVMPLPPYDEIIQIGRRARILTGADDLLERVVAEVVGVSA